jgi:hypothetical protein
VQTAERDQAPYLLRYKALNLPGKGDAVAASASEKLINTSIEELWSSSV